MIEVKFYDTADDNLIKFSVIAAKYNDKFVYCKNISRDTYEIPGGHREIGENVLETAKRELWEETGAVEYDIIPISIYSVIRNDENRDNSKAESFGMLFYANIKAFEKLPDYEIEKIEFFDKIPENLTYPEIQPKLLEKVIEILNNKDFIEKNINTGENNV